MSKILSGTAYWASVINPNTRFDDDGVWTIDVGNLDDLNKRKAKKDGLTIKDKGDEKGEFVTIKRRVRNNKGVRNRAPNVVDANKRLITDTMIGNGSKVKVQYKEWESTYRGQNYKGLDFMAMKVLDIVEYNGGVGDEFDVEDEEELDEL